MRIITNHLRCSIVDNRVGVTKVRFGNVVVGIQHVFGRSIGGRKLLEKRLLKSKCTVQHAYKSKSHENWRKSEPWKRNDLKQSNQHSDRKSKHNGNEYHK